MNAGVGAARLIDCIAAMPCASGRSRNAFMTNVEKATKTPPAVAAPTATAMVNACTDGANGARVGRGIEHRGQECGHAEHQTENYRDDP